MECNYIIVCLSLAFLWSFTDGLDSNDPNIFQEHFKRFKRQNGYRYDKPAIAFDLPGKAGSSAQNGYPSNAPKPKIPEARPSNPNFPSGGYPQAGPPKPSRPSPSVGNKRKTGPSKMPGYSYSQPNQPSGSRTSSSAGAVANSLKGYPSNVPSNSYGPPPNGPSKGQKPGQMYISPSLGSSSSNKPGYPSGAPSEQPSGGKPNQSYLSPGKPSQNPGGNLNVNINRGTNPDGSYGAPSTEQASKPKNSYIAPSLGPSISVTSSPPQQTGYPSNPGGSYDSADVGKVDQSYLAPNPVTNPPVVQPLPAPSLPRPFSNPETSYAAPQASESSTKGPPYLPPKPPSSSYDAVNPPNDVGMVIIVPDVPQNLESSTPGTKYLPQFPDDVKTDQQIQPVAPNDEEGGGYSDQKPSDAPSDSYLTPDSSPDPTPIVETSSISTPASTYLPPYSR